MQKRNLVKVLFAGLSLAAVITSLTSCKQKLTDTPLEGMQVVADFSEGKQKTFFPSDGWSNGDPFNVTWTGENVEYTEDGAKLSITESDKLYGAELRSTAHYHYGDYEITMKPEPKKGTCSSFFVYTGPSEIGEDGNPNPHDEIDIEFLGKDTTHVQFNFFVNGVGGNEYKYDLGFDASEEFHTYGFRWTESYITWYVDGEPVYRVDETAKKPLPKTAGRMMMNYWSGTENAELWMGKYSHPAEGEGSYYKVVKTSADAIVGETADADIDWPVLSPLSDLVAVPGDDKHVVTTNGSEYNVAYTDNVGATYTNVKFELDGAAEGKNYLHLKAKNNGSESASIRVDVFGEATNKTVNNSTVCNVAATMDGIEVATDLNWGGSTFNNIPAGETVEIVVYYEGIADSIQIMFHTHIYGDTETHSGNITISDVKFALYGELKLPEGNDEPLAPTLNINGVEKEFAGNLDSYILTKDGNNLTVSYADLAGNCYHNINAPINDVTNKNQLTVNITNNGSAMAKVRIDVNSNVKVNNTTASNTSATMNGVEVWTDTDWGGSSFDIAAGQTVTCVINFDNSRGLNNLMFFIESSRGDAEVYTGSITLSEVVFDYIPGENDGNEGSDPVLPPVEGEAVALEFTTAAPYQITNNAENKTNTVVYEGIMDSTWQCISANIQAVVTDNNKVSLTFTNNGVAAVIFRLDVGYDNAGTLVSQIINVSAGEYNFGEKNVTFTVEAGQEVTIIVEFDTTTPATGINVFIDSSVWKEEADRVSHSGNISISNIVFSK